MYDGCCSVSKVATKKGRQKIDGKLLQFGAGASFRLAPALSESKQKVKFCESSAAL